MSSRLIIPNADFSTNAIASPLEIFNNKTKSTIHVNGNILSVKSSNHGSSYYGYHVTYDNDTPLDCNVGDNYYDDIITSLVRPFAKDSAGNFDGEVLYIDLTHLKEIACLGEMFVGENENRPVNNSIKKIVFTGEAQNKITLYSPFSHLEALEEIVGLDKLLKKAEFYGNNLKGAFCSCKKLKTIDLSLYGGEVITGADSFIQGSDVKVDVTLPEAEFTSLELFFNSGSGGVLNAEKVKLSFSKLPSSPLNFENCIFKSIKLAATSSDKKLFNSTITKRVEIKDFRNSDIENIKTQLSYDWGGSEHVFYNNQGIFTYTE